MGGVARSRCACCVEAGCHGCSDGCSGELVRKLNRTIEVLTSFVTWDKTATEGDYPWNEIEEAKAVLVEMESKPWQEE